MCITLLAVHAPCVAASGGTGSNRPTCEVTGTAGWDNSLALTHRDAIAPAIAFALAVNFASGAFQDCTTAPGPKKKPT